MILAIIQARMESTRLPGKVLMPIAGKPLLWHVVEAVRKVKSVDRIVVAVPHGGENGAIAAACDTWEVPCSWQWSGDSGDVLGRFVAAMSMFHGCNRILRVCGDSPLFDSQAADELIVESVTSGADYTGYQIDAAPAVTKPTGYFGEVVTRSALECANVWLSHDDPRREHVTQVMYQDNRFRCHWVKPPEWYAREKMKSAAVDTMKDYLRVKGAME